MRLAGIYPLITCLCLGSALNAQTASIAGLVVDQTNSAIPGARVIALSPSTGVKIETAAKDDGSFVLDRVPVGRITMAVTFSGFGSTRESLDLSPAGRRDWKITLVPAAVSEQVNVAATSDLLQRRAPRRSALSAAGKFNHFPRLLATTPTLSSPRRASPLHCRIAPAAA